MLYNGYYILGFDTRSFQLVEAIESRVRGQPAGLELDMISWMGRTALELIGQAGLGYSFDPLVADTADDFGYAIKTFQYVLFLSPLLYQRSQCNNRPTMTGINLLRRLLPYVGDIGSPALRRKVLDFIPNPAVQNMKYIVDTMWRRSQEIYASKKRAFEQGDEAVAQQIGEGKDLMSILCMDSTGGKLYARSN